MTATTDPFGQLRDDDQAPAVPDTAFARHLRHRVTEALARRTPHIALPDRKQTTMTDSDTPGAPAAPMQIITPYITVHDGAAALDWYKEAFGAIETVRYVGDDGRLGHGEFLLNGARIMLSDAYPEIGVVAANSYEGSSCALHVEVEDCDLLHRRAVTAGATSMAGPADQPHGARTATILDPFGHRWMLSQHKSSPGAAQIDAEYEDFTVIESD